MALDPSNPRSSSTAQRAPLRYHWRRGRLYRRTDLGGAAPARRVESPAAKKSRLAWERARALRALERAAARWLSVETLCGPHRYRKVAPVGADLAPYLASSRKERRRQRPLYAAGYLETAAIAAPGGAQRLTEAGRAYLLGRLVEEQRRVYGAAAQPQLAA